ncbi:MAG: hypothetical protein IPG57_14350 [Burkholderiales bacterium]|jgi:hypothetical protein|nr:hypothetical protein [Burkholderiales bacterium]
MKDRTFQAIFDALDRLASGRPSKGSGKVTGVNLVKESGVSKATLYRYLEKNLDLRDAYDTLRRNGVRADDAVPENQEQANRLMSDEVKQLRSALVESRRQLEQEKKLRAHQIELLWLGNERLRTEVDRLTALVGGNVVSLLREDARTSTKEV